MLLKARHNSSYYTSPCEVIIVIMIVRLQVPPHTHPHYVLTGELYLISDVGRYALQSIFESPMLRCGHTGTDGMDENVRKAQCNLAGT